MLCHEPAVTPKSPGLFSFLQSFGVTYKLELVKEPVEPQASFIGILSFLLMVPLRVELSLGGLYYLVAFSVFWVPELSRSWNSC